MSYPSPLDLCTLAQVKAWIGSANKSTTYSDQVMQPLITAASRAIMAFLARPSLLPRTVTERYDGQGNQRFYLRQWPVLSIKSLSVFNTVLSPSQPPGPGSSGPAGYLLSPWDGAPPGAMQAIDLFGSFFGYGGSFERGRQNVTVSYLTGYGVQAEPWAVPSAPYVITPLATFGPAASDLGVVYAATGVSLVAVQSSPAVGQYMLTVLDGMLAYQFNVADEATNVEISYGYIPQDINQAAIEYAAERFVYRQRIGIRSQSVTGPGESISYDISALSKAIMFMLQPYRAVVQPV